MENKARKDVKHRKRRNEEHGDEACKKKLYKAKRKLVFDEETEGGTTISPRKADVQNISRLLDDQELIDEIQHSQRVKCQHQYNFDIVTGEELNGIFDWQIVEVTQPTNVLESGKPRHSLVH